MSSSKFIFERQDHKPLLALLPDQDAHLEKRVAEATELLNMDAHNDHDLLKAGLIPAYTPERSSTRIYFSHWFRVITSTPL